MKDYPSATALRDEINRLREALKKIAAIENDWYGGDWQKIGEARNIAFDALRDNGTLRNIAVRDNG